MNSNTHKPNEGADVPSDRDVPLKPRPSVVPISDIRSDVASTLGPQLPQLTITEHFTASPKDMDSIAMAEKVVGKYQLLDNPDTNPKLTEEALALYESLFPNADEREDSDLIRNRLRDPRKRRNEAGCFDIVVSNSKEGDHVIGYHQFATMPMPKSGCSVAYLQYCGVANDAFMKERHGKERNYRKFGVLTAQYALMQEIATKNGKETLNCPNGHIGTILESEMIGQAETPEDIQFTKRRLEIHNRTGAKAMLLKTADGRLITPHMQPALSADSKPIQLMMLFRPAKYDAAKLGEQETMDKEACYQAMMAFIDNFDKEGFDPEQVEAARQITKKRFEEATEVVLYPPDQLPNVIELAKMDPVLREQVERDYGDLDEHAAAIKAALTKPEVDAKWQGM